LVTAYAIVMKRRTIVAEICFIFYI